MDNDPQPRRVFDPHFTPDIIGEIMDAARDATAIRYPEARIPETEMPTNGEDPAAAKLDQLAEILDATNLAAEAKYEIIRIAMEYGGLRAAKARGEP